jgi:hypothetical protein
MDKTVLEYIEQDIQSALDNHEWTQMSIYEMVRDAESVYEFSYMLHEYYDAAIEFIVRETPENCLGNLIVQIMCTNLPHSVFESLARHYWAGYTGPDFT